MEIRSFFTECCLICGVTEISSQTSDGVCHRCLDELRSTPGPFCLQIGTLPVFAAREYAGIVQEALRAYKSHGVRRIGRTLARELLFPLTRMVQATDGENTRIVSVPAHPGNRRARGFDQASDLAIYLADETGIQAERPFQRKGRTAQKSLGQTEREANAQRSIVLRPSTRRSEKCSNTRRFILIDDVVTTGATIRRCSELLDALSAHSVTPLVLATAL